MDRYKDHKNYTHIRRDIEDGDVVKALFEEYQFERVVNLAAQAGVRYSIENPLAYKANLDFKFPNEPLTQKRLEIAMINKLNDIQ